MSLPLPSPESESKPTTPSTNPTTPEQLPLPHHSDDDDDDIWASDNSHHDSSTNIPTNPSTNLPPQNIITSNLPLLKRQHMTSGYREGLSVGKSLVMQKGFDQGYPIGVEIASRVGLVLGVLEGWVLASRGRVRPRDEAASTSERAEQERRQRELEKMYEKAKEELGITRLLEGVGDEDVMNAVGVWGRVERVILEWERRVSESGIET